MYLKKNIYNCKKCGDEFHCAVRQEYCMECRAEGIDKDAFITGIPAEELKHCPSCGRRTCFHIGIVPVDVKCSNKQCRFYVPYYSEDWYKEHGNGD